MALASAQCRSNFDRSITCHGSLRVLTLSDLQRQAMYDNPWLRSGYRPLGFNSYVECLISLFYPHNDLLNVYTHLAGAIYFVYEGFTAFSRLGTKGANMDDRLVFFTYAMLVRASSLGVRS